MTMDEMIDELVRLEANLYTIGGDLLDRLPTRPVPEDLVEFPSAEAAVRDLVREVGEKFAMEVLDWHLKRERSREARQLGAVEWNRERY